MRPLKSSELIGVWQGSAKELAVQIRCIARQSRIKGVKGTIEGELHLLVPRGLTSASVGFTDNVNGWIDVTIGTITADSNKVTTAAVGRLERDTSGNLYLTTIENKIFEMFPSVERIALTRFSNRTRLRSRDIEELFKSCRKN